MADSNVDITQGSGTSIDTRTESTNGNHRQVVVLGDPATNAGVAPVDATAGLKVDLGADNDVVVTNAGTFAVQADNTKVGGTSIDTNSGNKSAGTQRVVLATDQPQLTNALKVDGSAVTQPVSGTFWQATQPISGTVTASNVSGDVASAATDSGNPVKVGAVYRATPSTLTDGQRGDLIADTRQNLKTTLVANNSTTAMKNAADNADSVAASSTTNNLGVVNRNTVFNGSTWDRQYGNATDGTQVYTKGTASDNSITGTKVIAAASTNATSVKASAGKIYLIHAYNSDTVGYWVKMYNKASAPTVGTDVPVDTMYAPPGGGFVIAADLGNYYSTGIALATTLLATDADTTAVTNANKLVINLRYA